VSLLSASPPYSHDQIRRDLHRTFEAEVNHRFFGIKPPRARIVAADLQTLLGSCGVNVNQALLDTFIANDILSIEDAKLVFCRENANLLQLPLVQWYRLCNELNPKTPDVACTAAKLSDVKGADQS
jgi:hypothetical protein